MNRPIRCWTPIPRSRRLITVPMPISTTALFSIRSAPPTASAARPSAGPPRNEKIIVWIMSGWDFEGEDVGVAVEGLVHPHGGIAKAWRPEKSTSERGGCRNISTTSPKPTAARCWFTSAPRPAGVRGVTGRTHRRNQPSSAEERSGRHRPAEHRIARGPLRQPALALEDTPE